MDARSGFSYREHHQGTSREAWLEAAGLDLPAAGLSTALFRGGLAWASVTFDCKESRGEEGVTPFGLVSCLGKLCLWMVCAYALQRAAQPCVLPTTNGKRCRGGGTCVLEFTGESEDF